jgi:DNA-binding CsgD family transcriptional regulator/tetratricopeptide (TPR) repeat protein
VRALREAVARQVLVVTEGGAAERYQFRHALMQEAIYQDLLPTERTRLHATFAQTIAALPGSSADPSRAAELAHHWYAAHDLPRALVASVEAAKAAEQAYAFAEALTQYERALGLWDEVPDAAERLGTGRLELLEHAARAAAVTDAVRAVALIREAIAMVDPASDPARAGLLHERLGRYSWLAGTPGVLAAYREAVRLVPREPPSAARAKVVAGLAQLLMGGSDTEAESLAAEAIEMARAVGAREVEAHALVTRGSALSAIGRIEEGLAALEEAKRTAVDIGAMEDLVRAWKYMGVSLIWAGRLEESIVASDRAFELARRHGYVHSHAVDALEMAFWPLMEVGRWDEAERTVELIERHGHHAASARAAASLHNTRAYLALQRGRVDEAERHTAGLETIARSDEEGENRLPAWHRRADLALLQGRPLDARAAVRQAFAATEGREWRPRDVAHTCDLAIKVEAEIGARSRRRDERRTASQNAAAYLARMRDLHEWVVRERPAFAREIEADLALCEAEAGRVDGHGDPAAWSRAARRFEEFGAVYRMAYARFREAQAMLGTSRARTKASGPLAEAYRIALRLGAVPLRNDIEAVARRTRIDLPRPDTAALPTGGSATSGADRFGLTRREREVLELLAAGSTNRQIASILYITEKTAGAHVSNILSKLDARGRTEAAAVAHREGLLIPAEH